MGYWTKENREVSPMTYKSHIQILTLSMIVFAVTLFISFPAAWCQPQPSPSYPVSYSLTITKSGAGTGTVTSTPTGINCGSNCSSYSSGTITLTATPDACSIFLGWTGEGCSGTGTCAVTMNSGKAVTAIFDLKKVLKGDVNGDSKVDLADAILVLQVLSNVTPSAAIYKQADVKEDQKIGLKEAIYALQEVAGLRPSINISAASAVPGSLLTIGVSGFDPAAALSVRLFDEKGFTVTIPAIKASANAVHITVPPLINMTTGGFEHGFVNVELIQTLGTTTLRSNPVSGFEIGSLPALTLPPGSVSANVAGFLELALTDTENRLLEIDTTSGGQINTLDLRSRLETMRIQFGQLKNKIRAAIANPGQAETVGVINGIPVTLDQQSLRVADQWMVAVIDGILAELQRTPMQEASPSYARSLLALPQAIGCTQEDPVLCGMEKTLTGYKTVDGSEQLTSQEYLRAVVPAARDKVADLSAKFGAAAATIGAAVVIAGGSVPLSVVALLTTATVVGGIAVFGMDAAALSSRSDDKEAAKRLLEDFNGQIESVLIGAVSPIIGAISTKAGILFDLAAGWKPILEDKIPAYLTQAKTFIAAEPPPTCVYTYSDWSECQSNSAKTRTIVTTSPSGCVGTPVLSQSCTYTPPPTTYQGTLTGSWSGGCVYEEYSYNVSGGLSLIIQADGSITGNYNGESSGLISGSVSNDGSYTAGSAGGISWAGTIRRSNSSLSATGSWGGTVEGAYCNGSWSGSGTASP